MVARNLYKMQMADKLSNSNSMQSNGITVIHVLIMEAAWIKSKADNSIYGIISGCRGIT